MLMPLHRHGTIHTRAKKDTSNTNLKNHAECCDLKAKMSTSKQLKIDEVASQYTHGEFRLLHAEWMDQLHCPQAIIQDPGLQKIYRLLNPRVQIHSDMTVGCDIKEVYEVSKEQLKEMLKEHEGRFHIAFDAWAVLNHHDYPGVVLIWCHDGHIEVITLDLIEYVLHSPLILASNFTGRLTKAHTGIYLAEQIMEVLKEYNWEELVLGTAGDNASVNDTTLNELEYLFQEISMKIMTGCHTQIRCFAHILNLVVKVCLFLFLCPVQSHILYRLYCPSSNQSDAQRSLRKSHSQSVLKLQPMLTTMQ